MNELFEPAFIKELEQFGTLQHFKEGDFIKDYGKFIRMMIIVLKGIIKSLKLNKNNNDVFLLKKKSEIIILSK